MINFNYNTYEYIDAHCHIEDKSFNKNREEIVSNAKSKNVGIITSGATYGGCLRGLEYSKKYNIGLTLGYHPSGVKSDDKVISKVYNLISGNINNILAIGEVGLDINVKDINRQEEIFKKFLNLSKSSNKPVVIHARGLEERCYKIFNEITKNEVKCLFHCYSGNISLAKKILDDDNFISISTLVCFSKFHQDLIKNIDLKNVVVETDSPYLSPIKGEKNQPVNVILSVKKIFKLKKEEGYSYDEVREIILENTRRFYRI